MADRRVLAVVGATGAQGGGLARAALESDRYALRALTRNVDSDGAKELAGLGAELVQADLDEPASLVRAFQGAYGAFCVTNFWEHFSPERESAQAAAMAAAAKQAGVRHTIWSTLEDTRRWVPLDDDRMPTLMGEYKVPHFDAKGAADRLFLESGAPATCLLTSFYWDNLIHFGMGPTPGEDGRLVFSLPMADKKLPGIAAADIGRCAFGIFEQGEPLFGKTVGIAGEHLSGAEMAAALSRGLGREVVYQDVPLEVYRGLDFPGAADLGNMFQFKRDFQEVFCGARDVGFSRSLHPALRTFAEWVEEHKEQLLPG